VEEDTFQSGGDSPPPRGKDMVVEIGGMYVAKWTNNDGTYTNIVPEWPFMCSWGTDLVWLDQDDWRLPTKDELITICANKGVIGDYHPSWYWSSTQAAESDAYGIDFSSCTLYELPISTAIAYVRAVREVEAPTPEPTPTPTETPTPLPGFARVFRGADYDHAYSIQQTSDGGYIVAGATYSYGAGNENFLILKLDSSGNQTWARTFGRGGYDHAYSIQQTSDGGYIVAGDTGSYGEGDCDLLILKLDPSGNISDCSALQNVSPTVTIPSLATSNPAVATYSVSLGSTSPSLGTSLASLETIEICSGTPTATVTPTEIPTATPSVTITPTGPPTQTPTEAPTGTPTVTLTPTVTGTPFDKGQAYFYVSARCTPPSKVDDTTGNRLEVGDLIQVIYSNGEIDPPDPSDPNYIGGDDELFGNFAVGDDEQGWGDIGAGEFTISVFGRASAKVYIRAWDAGTIAAANYYGESGVYTLVPPPSVPPDYCLPSFSTNNSKPAGGATATPTETPTETLTITPTQTPTITPTSTEPPTQTATPPIPTPTRTPTPSPTSTATVRVEETSTATPSPTETPTRIPQAEILLNGSSFAPGAGLEARFLLHKTIDRSFTAFAVVILPDGTMLNLLTLKPKLAAVVENMPGLAAPFDFRLLASVVPVSVQSGDYEIVVAFFDPQKPITRREDAFLDVSAHFAVTAGGRR